ncbi:hypothetical protein [Devosia sp. 2618]|uniref:hypothetical protein n=1 Tax=Devosia sp. 2618 TaxID=3156454 RepID=UPI003393E1C9
MTNYTQVRFDLEAAREGIGTENAVDQCLGQLLDHVIETVLRIEHLTENKRSNVLQFPAKFGNSTTTS